VHPGHKLTGPKEEEEKEEALLTNPQSTVALSPFSHKIQFSWTSSKLNFSKQPEAQSYFISRILCFSHGNTGFTRRWAQTPHSRHTSTYVTTYIFWTTRHNCLLRHFVWNSFASLLWPKDASDRNKVPWPPILKSWYIIRFVKYSTWVSIMCCSAQVPDLWEVFCNEIVTQDPPADTHKGEIAEFGLNWPMCIMVLATTQSIWWLGNGFGWFTLWIGGGKRFFFQNVHTGCGAHLASCWMGTGASSPIVKWLE
jgi:hypothetical protein